MTQISRSPPRVLVKAIFEPSGDQTGSPSKASSVVSWVSLLPSGFITQTSVEPARSLSNAILLVDDQAGSPSNASENVSSRTWVPSARAAKMFMSPRRSLSKTIRLPLADQYGFPSVKRVGEVSRFGAPPFGLTTKSADPAL